MTVKWLMPLALSPVLLAQDIQLGLDRQDPRSLEIRPPSGYLRLDSKPSDALAIRFSWDLWKPTPGQALELTAGYRFASERPLTYVNSTGASGRVPTATELRIDRQVALGALFRFERPFDWPLELGLGLEQRWERLVMKDGGLESAGRLDRLWVRGVVRHRFAQGGAGPFVALEYARPLRSAPTPAGVDYLQDLDHLGSSPNPGTSAKAHGSTYSLTLAAGYRFGRKSRAVGPGPSPAPAPVPPAEPAVAPVPEPPPPADPAPPAQPSAAQPPTVQPSAAQPPAAPAPVAPRTITLDAASLHFALNRATLPPQGVELLRTWAGRIKTLEQIPHLIVVGHTDATGPRALNLRLSLARANAVADVLRAEGLPAERVEGAGPDQPLVSGDTPEGRARNRRVEIRLEGEGIQVEGQSASDLVLETPATPARKP